MTPSLICVFADIARGETTYDVYRYDFLNSQRKQLTTSSFYNESFPALSPDGGRVAYESTGSLGTLYLVDVDGSNLMEVGNILTPTMPAWSPTGLMIAFVALTGNDLNMDLFVVSADGTNLRRVTSNGGMKFFPRWLPNGDQLSFLSTSGTETLVEVVNLDGSQQSIFLSSPKVSSAVDWSPDGQWVVFSAQVPNAPLDSEIFVMKADGSNLKQLTNGPDANYYPVWAAGGSKIIYTRLGGVTGSEIWMMSADGTQATAITTGTSPSCR